MLGPAVIAVQVKDLYSYFRSYRVRLIVLFFIIVGSAPLAAQDIDSDEIFTFQSVSLTDESEIVVSGSQHKEVQTVRSFTTLVTRPARIDKPIARFYQPFCPVVIGIKTQYASMLIDRISMNARNVGARVANEDCRPNVLLIFAHNGRETVETLRDEQPWLFANLLHSEVKRIFENSDTTYAWHTTELRGVDGKQLRIEEVEIGNPPMKREVIINQQYQTGRLNPPIRMDMSGAVLLIDMDYLNGKSLEQLADYATMRLLASTEGVSAEDAPLLSTILSLFSAPETAPLSLTRFDISYLRAIYSMRPNAKSDSIRDATVRAYLNDQSD